MGSNQGKPSFDNQANHSNLKVENFSDAIESHEMTLNRPFGLERLAEASSLTIEYHLTISVTNSSLSRRELSLLLDVLNYQAVNFGLNLNMLLAIYELYFRLLGNKYRATDIREERIRLTLTVSELILKIASHSDFSLSSTEVIKFSGKYKELLSKGLMTKRTYGSRFRTYRPEKYLAVRIVPVDIQFLKRNKDTQPYSSYTKGYGESHPSAHKQSLKPSAEYDGSGESPLSIEEIILFERCTKPLHVLSEYLLLRYENLKQEEK